MTSVCPLRRAAPGHALRPRAGRDQVPAPTSVDGAAVLDPFLLESPGVTAAERQGWSMTFGERFAGRRQMGFSTTELIVVCGILGLLAAVSVPFFVTYYQSAALKAATEEVAALLNQGRQVAIKENQSVCAQT